MVSGRGGYGQTIVQTFDPNSPAIDAGKMLFAYTTHKSGPAVGGDAENMATAGATPGTPSIFEYTVPANTQMRVARLNFAIIDQALQLVRFGGLAALANGCLLDVVDTNGLPLLDMTGGRPFTTNADFLYGAGIDMEIDEGGGGALDVVKVRFSMFKAGRNVIVRAGESVRWTIRDDLTGIDQFRCQVQGTMTI